MHSYTINWILLMVLSAIWGGAFTLNKLALQNYSPEIIVAGRLIIGSIILIFLLIIIFRKLEFNYKQFNYFFIMSVFGIVAPFLLIIHGQKNIDSSMAGILMSTMPISTLILSHFFLHDEAMTRKKLFGFITAFISIIILIAPDTSNIENQSNGSELMSELMVMFGAILYSFAAVYGKKYKNTNALNASTGTIFLSAIIMFIYLIFLEDNNNIQMSDFLSIPILLLGVFCTAIATILYFQILQSSGATFLSIMNYLIPIWSIIFGLLIFNEKIFWNYIIGLVVVIIGIQISEKDIRKI